MRDTEREAAWTKRLVRIGEFLEALEDGKGRRGAEGATLKEVRMLLNTRESGDTLIVIKASDGGVDIVAFVGARSVGEAILTWRQKDTGKGLKWRKDTPWDER